MTKNILSKRYMKILGDPHDNLKNIFSCNFLDFHLRHFIGKEQFGLCKHSLIISREMGEKYCRICNKELKVGVGRYNDYLVLRNKGCPAPICLDCSKNNPDDFHMAFKKGLEKYNNFRNI